MDEIEPSFNSTEEMKDIRSGLSSEEQENVDEAELLFNATRKLMSMTNSTDVEYYEKVNDIKSVPVMSRLENRHEVESLFNDTNRNVSEIETSDVEHSNEMEEACSGGSVVNNTSDPISGHEDVDVKPFFEASKKITSISKSTEIDYFTEMQQVRTLLIIKNNFFKIGYEYCYLTLTENNFH